jgi:hypothetical protein
MLTLTIMLGVASALLELYVVFRSRTLLAMIERWSVSGLVLSLGVSVALGSLFGAAGLVALGAGIVSSCLTVAAYSAWRLGRGIKSRLSEARR